MGIKLVIGLGNPGPEYASTRHNAGFATVDALADQLGASYWKDQCGAKVAVVRYPGAPDGQLVLAKPQAYMNESGGPVKRLLARFEAGLDEIVVIHDELDIPAGDVRVKNGGGHAGHNGLRSIIAKTGANDFVRVRVGIGRPPGRMDAADFVLQPLRNDDLEDFLITAKQAAAVVLYTVDHGVTMAMNEFNRKAD